MLNGKVKILLVAVFWIPSLFSDSSALHQDTGLGSYIVSTIAGSGIRGTLDGRADRSRFNWPTGVAVDSEGVIYVADFSNNLIRSIGKDGHVSTIAGSGRPGFADGKGREAALRGPDNITIDGNGNLLFADADNYRIRKIDNKNVVTTVAGTGSSGYRDGKTDEAMFGYPTGVAVDGEGNIYVADRRSHTVRKISADGTVRTIAGNGHPGLVGGKGMASHLREPVSVAVDGYGIVYIADSGNNVIRKVDLDGSVTILAGSGRAGYRDGRGKGARFAWPTGIAIDPMGNIYVCDSRNNRIRRITPDGMVSTVAGGTHPGHSNGPGYLARLNFPTGIYVDRLGTIYVADSGNNVIRKITQGGLMEAGREKRHGGALEG